MRDRRGAGPPSEAADDPVDGAPGPAHGSISPRQPGSLNRRAALGTLGVGAVGGLVAGGGLLAWRNLDEDRKTAGSASPGSTNDSANTTSGSPSPAGLRPSGVTVASWAAGRGKTYHIAHRGSGDVYPEHTMEAYQAALGAGAQCLEISVGVTSDGTLICHHDLTYDRVTTATGSVADQPSTILRSVSISAPQLGPAWASDPLPRIPVLDRVLREVGGRAVLCLEAKADSAFPAMMSMAEGLGLKQSIVVKAHHTSSRIAQAKAAGYPVFGYLGSADEMTTPNIASLAAKLDAASDFLVVPSSSTADQIRACVATGIPVWVYPLHRRSEAARFFSLGVVGAICSSFAYISGSASTATMDTWRYKAIAAGEMTRDPSSPSWAPEWTGPDELTLAVHGSQHFITLGQLAPLPAAAGSYSIEFEAAFATLPQDGTSNLSLAFGHDDDAYYEHQLGSQNGYHAVLRVDGRLGLFQHVAGDPAGKQLGPTVNTPAAGPGQWMRFKLDVTPTTVTWARLDQAASDVIAVTDSTMRGGYLHVGRSAKDGALSIRRFSVR